MWCTKQDQLVYRECTRPPSVIVLVDKMNAYCTNLGYDSGVTHKRGNYPDKAWLIRAVATLSNGKDEIFDPGYVPAAGDIRRDQQAEVIYVHNDDGLLNVPEQLIPKKKGRVVQMVTLSKADRLKAKIMLAESQEQQAIERATKLK